MQANIVLVHTGHHIPPEYLFDNIDLLLKLCPRSHLYLAVSQQHALPMERLGRCQVVFEESIPASSLTQRYANSAQFNEGFRNGFWRHTSQRFFVLHDLCAHLGMENIVHIENDVLLFEDPSSYIAALKQFAPLAYPVDRIRGIASFFFARESACLAPLLEHFIGNPTVNDMDNLGQFLANAGPSVARPLPTLPPNYSAAKGLDAQRYSAEVEAFGGIFDAAAVGQYLGGVDPKNTPLDSRFFQNESSDLALAECEISWDVHEGVRSPQISYQGQKLKMLNLHMHCKRVKEFSPYQHEVPTSEAQIITGERLQAQCDITIASADIVQFHGRDNIKTREIFVPGYDSGGRFLYPTATDIALIDSCDKIFVYTHFLWYFTAAILPQLDREHILVLHNSDDMIGPEHLRHLENPKIKEWHVFGSQFSHPKLRHMPAGLGNKQWAHGDTAELFRQSRHIVKSKWIYVNFNITHPSRKNIAEALKDRTDVTYRSGLSYPEYLAELKQHRYCICPRGNNVDSHRFWECQYLDVTPIICLADWLPAFSGKRYITVPDWSQLSLEKLI
jgi:hypothetical protein